MSSNRLALDEVRVQGVIYGFASPDMADQFQTCLLFDALDDCASKFPPCRCHPMYFDADGIAQDR